MTNACPNDGREPSVHVQSSSRSLLASNDQPIQFFTEAQQCELKRRYSSPTQGSCVQTYYGLFKETIRKGEVVVRWENTRELSAEEYKNLGQEDLKFIDVQDGRIFLVGEPERFSNHSCDPNTIFGQEVTHHVVN